MARAPVRDSLPRLSEQQTYFATCAPGLAPLLHQEIRDLGCRKSECQVGGVRFEGSRREEWLANLKLATGVRVLRRLARFMATDADALYEGVSAIDWSPYLQPDGRLWIDAQSRDSALDHTRFIEQRVKDAVVDQLRTEDGRRPIVDRDNADLQLHLHLFKDRATLSLDSSGGSLHKRGWRLHQGMAPLSETLAAAIVRMSEWDKRAPVLDPFCGSGTLLIEAALYASGRPPGSYREQFGFERLPGHDARGFAALKVELDAEIKMPRKLKLFGWDSDPERVEEARANVAAAGFEDTIEIAVRDASEFAPRPGWNAWILTNPPYGERVGDEDELVEVYRTFGDRLREHCTGYHLALLSGNTRLSRALGFDRAQRIELKNGALECELIRTRIGE